MAQGDVPISPGGPLRRRREKRQLERLAGKAARRESGQSAARTHVSVVEEQAEPKAREPDADGPDAAASKPSGDTQPRGFHVNPVPIDQPLDENGSRSSEAVGDGNGLTS
jgi:hypothetical protein